MLSLLALLDGSAGIGYAIESNSANTLALTDSSPKLGVGSPLALSDWTIRVNGSPAAAYPAPLSVVATQMLSEPSTAAVTSILGRTTKSLILVPVKVVEG